MKKLKLSLVAAALLCAGNFYALVTEIVNLSTGVYGGNTIAGSGLIPYGTNDDTWTVKFPGGSGFQPTYSSYSTLWNSGYNANFTCGRWISPEPVNYNGSGPGCGTCSSITDQGIYQYRMNFTPQYNCKVVSARLVFSWTQADNELQNVQVNSFNYNYPAPGHQTKPNFANASWSPGAPYVINLSASDIITGSSNTVDFFVYNSNSGTQWTVTGLALCAYLEITYENFLAPGITGPTSLCSSDPLTFTGSGGAGVTATSYQWEIQECTSAGVPINPQSVWTSPLYTGAPGVFTYPAISFVQCNKYFLVKLKTNSACETNVTKTKVVFIKCSPGVRISRDQTICKGSCTYVYLATQANPNFTYTWYKYLPFTDEPPSIGTGEMVYVCPTETSTYYVVVTDPSTGCSTRAVTTVYVEIVNPNFNTSINPVGSYMTVGSTPIQTSNFPAGFGYSWTVEELNASNATVYSVVNPSCWWNFPGVPTNVFSGLQGLIQNYNTSCLPATGQFKYSTTYRITRGVWSDICPWSQASILVRYNPGFPTGRVINVDGPDMSGTAQGKLADTKLNAASAYEGTRLYPNPSQGLINIEFPAKQNGEGQVVITNVLGHTLKTMDANGQSQITIDMSDVKNGIYMVQFYVSGQHIKTEKLIIQH